MKNLMQDLREFTGLDIETVESWPNAHGPGRILEMVHEGMRLRAIWQEDRKNMIVRQFATASEWEIKNLARE